MQAGSSAGCCFRRVQERVRATTSPHAPFSTTRVGPILRCLSDTGGQALTSLRRIESGHFPKCARSIHRERESLLRADGPPNFSRRNPDASSSIHADAALRSTCAAARNAPTNATPGVIAGVTATGNPPQHRHARSLEWPRPFDVVAPPRGLQQRNVGPIARGHHDAVGHHHSGVRNRHDLLENRVGHAVGALRDRRSKADAIPNTDDVRRDGRAISNWSSRSAARRDAGARRGRADEAHVLRASRPSRGARVPIFRTGSLAEPNITVDSGLPLATARYVSVRMERVDGRASRPGQSPPTHGTGRSLLMN